MIVADTSAVVALVDADDRHHRVLRELFEADPHAWVLPWAILPEADYLLAKYLGPQAERLFAADVMEGRYWVEWGTPRDLARMAELSNKYAGLKLGLVDAAVITIAERLKARGIATLDQRHFAAVRIAGSPALYPRDLQRTAGFGRKLARPASRPGCRSFSTPTAPARVMVTSYSPVEASRKAGFSAIGILPADADGGDQRRNEAAPQLHG